MSRARSDESKPVLIERTAKKYKFLQLVGAIICITGTFSCFMVGMYNSYTAPDGSFGAPAKSLSVMIIGLAIYLLGRVGAWWHHA